MHNPVAREVYIMPAPDICNTTDPWRPMGKVLDLIGLPIICLVGLFLNIACMSVFTQRFVKSIHTIYSFYPSRSNYFRRRHPLVPALILLSICDSLQLLFSLFVLYLPAMHDHLEMDEFGWVAQIA